jgi:nucleotide-binding universal stress UspA family protein
MRGQVCRREYNTGMKTFLVPVDFSAVSMEIVDTAVTFARSFGGKVVLLNVIQPPIITSEYALPVEAVQETIIAAEKDATAKLSGYTGIFQSAGLGVEAIVRHGPPVYAILEEAEKAQADFIIMGSHGHGKLYDLLVGSTASGVIKGAKCGVIIMPPVDKTSPVASIRQLAEV